MRVNLLVARQMSEFHLDGSLDLTRAGTRHVVTDIPSSVVLAVLAFITPDPGDAGRHEFSIRMIDEDGQTLGQEFKTRLDVAKEHKTVRTSLLIGLDKPVVGYLEARVDGNLHDRYQVTFHRRKK